MTPEKQQMIDWLLAKGACREGREWAERECNSLAEVWANAKPEWLIWVAGRALDKRKRVAFAASCAERVRHLMTDQRSKDALDVAHRYGRGEATDEELSAAAAAAARMLDSAGYRTTVTSTVAAAAAAACAAYAAAAYAGLKASAGAREAEHQWQAAHLRENFQPDWSL